MKGRIKLKLTHRDSRNSGSWRQVKLHCSMYGNVTAYRLRSLLKVWTQVFMNVQLPILKVKLLNISNLPMSVGIPYPKLFIIFIISSLQGESWWMWRLPSRRWTWAGLQRRNILKEFDALEDSRSPDWVSFQAWNFQLDQSNSDNVLKEGLNTIKEVRTRVPFSPLSHGIR